MNGKVGSFASLLAVSFFPIFYGCDVFSEKNDAPDSVPSGLSARFDTASSRVLLAWKPARGDIAGYLVYRAEAGSEIPALMNADKLIHDTAFSDGVSDSPERNIRYWVKSQDNQANTSIFSAPASVHVVPKNFIQTRLRLEFPGPNHDTLAYGDTLVVNVHHENDTRRSVRIRAGMIGSDSAWIDRSASDLTGTETLRLFRAGASDYSLWVEVLDDGDGKARAEFHAGVRPRRPVLSAPIPDSVGLAFSTRVVSAGDPDLSHYVLVAGSAPPADTAGGRAWAISPNDTSLRTLGPLFPGTVYHLRLFAIDSAGLISAGEDVPIKTQAGTAWIRYDTLPEPAYYPEYLHAHTFGNQIIIMGTDGAAVRAYDPITATYRSRSPLPGQILGTRETVALGSRIYVLPGVAANEQLRYADGLVLTYDFESDQWNSYLPQTFGRVLYGSAACAGKIYLLGGDSSTFQGRPTLVSTTNVSTLDVDIGNWSTLPSLPAAGTPILATVLDGKLICLVASRRFELSLSGGGWDDKGGVPNFPVQAQFVDSLGQAYFFTSDSVTRYDSRSGTWRSRPNLAGPHPASAVAEYRGTLLVFGGDYAEGEVTNPHSVKVPNYIYQPALDGF